MKLLIRADAGAQIGAGHVMRCLALAQACQDSGGTATFVTAREIPTIESRLHSEGFEVIRLTSEPGSEEDAVETARLARCWRTDWVLVDGYQFSTRYESIVRDQAPGLLVLDDYGHAVHHHADIIVNQNIYASELMYRETVGRSRLLLGPRYALLRREFSRWLGWERTIPTEARRVLVTLGGGDPDNVTENVVGGIGALDGIDVVVQVVVGQASPHLASLRRAAALAPCDIEILPGAGAMSELMAWADVAVSGGGSTTWELAFLGLPALVVVLAENQRPVAEGLEAAGIGCNMGWPDQWTESTLTRTLAALIQDPERRAVMSARGRRLVDGRGQSRVLAAMRREDDRTPSRDAQ